MSDSTIPKAVHADPDDRGGVEEASQQPSGPGNRQGSGEWPDPDTPPADVVDYEPQRVPVNMYETEGAVVLVLPLPGVMADDISIDIEDDRLHVNATERTPAEKDYIAHEWHYGPYERMVTIPKGFGGPASATFGNGQLAIRVQRGDERNGKVVVQPSQAGT